MEHLPWIEKYRPSNIDDIIGQSEIINCLKKLIENESLPHFLFYGNPGTGKTSTILALSRIIYGNKFNLMVLKLDASDDRGINTVRDQIKGFAERENMFNSGVKLIILDEADSMTYDAQFALRRIIEKYSDTTRFCLICNFENKIIPAIKSRCANFRFNTINKDNYISYLEKICKNEKIKYDNSGLETVYFLSNGDLRKGINLLQSISMNINFKNNKNIKNNKILDEKLCYKIAGYPSKKDITKIITILINKNINFKDSLTKLEKYFDNGINVSVFINMIFKQIFLNHRNIDNFSKIISDLADLEARVVKSTFSNIFIPAVIGIFKNT
jgi:replication factor C subunit 3/5